MSGSDSRAEDPTRADSAESSIGNTATDDSSRPRGELELLASGDTIDRYQILSVLGTGGMGVVYRAHDPDLERDVALKLLRDPAAGSAGGNSASAQRLLREARAMAKLVHPNLVTVFDVGTSEGRVFVAMEYVEGSNLKEWMSAGRRSFRERFELLLAAGRGIAKAHAAGVVHRDLKPDNILVRDDGTPLVADFGLARRADEGEGPVEPAARRGDPMAIQLTSTGALLGTPAYMSPEQFLGKPADARSDQFSFAVVVHWALFGKRPFVGQTVEELAAAVLLGKTAPPPVDHDVPRKLLPVLQRALRNNPEARYPSMDDFLAALEHAAASRRRKLFLATTGVGVLGLAGAAALVVLRAPQQQPAPSPPPAVAVAPAPEVDPAVEKINNLLTLANAAASGVGRLMGKDVEQAVRDRLALEVTKALARLDQRDAGQAMEAPVPPAPPAPPTAADLARQHQAEIERHAVQVERLVAEAERRVAQARELGRAAAMPKLDATTADFHAFGEMLLLAMLRRHRVELDGCLRDADSRSSVLTFTVGPDGRLSRVVAVVRGADAAEIAGCVARVGADWQLPRPADGRAVDVTAPIQLSGSPAR